MNAIERQVARMLDVLPGLLTKPLTFTEITKAHMKRYRYPAKQSVILAALGNLMQAGIAESAEDGETIRYQLKRGRFSRLT